MKVSLDRPGCARYNAPHYSNGILTGFKFVKSDGCAAELNRVDRDTGNAENGRPDTVSGRFRQRGLDNEGAVQGDLGSAFGEQSSSSSLTSAY